MSKVVNRFIKNFSSLNLNDRITEVLNIRENDSKLGIKELINEDQISTEQLDESSFDEMNLSQVIQNYESYINLTVLSCLEYSLDKNNPIYDLDIGKNYGHQGFLLKKIFLAIDKIIVLTNWKFFYHNESICRLLEKMNNYLSNGSNKKKSSKYFEKYNLDIKLIFDMILIQLNYLLNFANILTEKFTCWIVQINKKLNVKILFRSIFRST